MQTSNGETAKLKLSERYRPRAWGEVIGQEKATQKLKKFLSMGAAGGRAFLFEGEPGSGKTTAALILGRALGIIEERETLESITAGSNMDVRFLKAGECTIETVRELSVWMGMSSWRGRKLIIVDEADTMNARALSTWRNVLETIPRDVTVIFTTADGLDTKADLFGATTQFGSRCTTVHFEKPNSRLIETRLREIAHAETGDGAGLNYGNMIRYGKCNVRTCVDLLEQAVFEM